MLSGNWEHQRRYPRYKVAGWENLLAEIDRNRTGERIITLSHGGCGFYGFDARWPLRPNQRVFTTLRVIGNDHRPPLVLQGNLIYTRPIELKNSIVYFHGVEFLPTERLKLRGIIETLEKLHQEKKIQISE